MMKFLDLCSGIGAFRMAAENLGHQCIGYVEIDKFARASYEAIYDTSGEWTEWDLQDVTNEEWASFRGEVDIIMAGFPCQAFSVAGKRLGFKDPRGTLFFEIARAIQYAQPKYFLLENVKNLLSHDRGQTIDTIIYTLCSLGYTVDYTVLNSKYYGVPQNRERVFIVGVKDGKTEKWKIRGNSVLARSKRRIASYGWAKTFNFDWPDNDQVTTQLVDILEDEKDVPENLYLSPEKTRTLIQSILERDEKRGRTDSLRMLGLLDMKGKDSTRRVYDPLGICPTLTTKSGGHTEPKILVAGNVNPSKRGIGGQVYFATGGLSPTINAGHEGGKQILYLRKQEEPTLRPIGNVNPSKRGMNGQVHQAENGLAPTLSTNKGEGSKIAYCPILNPDRVKTRQNGRRLKEDGEEMFTLTAQDRHGIVMYEKDVIEKNYVVRKLTPKECWRLQAFPDWAYEKAASVNSMTQLYKQAGNAVTVTVAEAILRKLAEWASQHDQDEVRIREEAKTS